MKDGVNDAEGVVREAERLVGEPGLTDDTDVTDTADRNEDAPSEERSAGGLLSGLKKCLS